MAEAITPQTRSLPRRWDMDSIFQILDEFADNGVRHALNLLDGTHLEGYVLDVDHQALTFGPGGPLAPPDVMRIPLAQIDLESLAYYDEQARAWVKFTSVEGFKKP